MTEDQFLNDSGNFTSVVKLNLEFVEFNLLQNWSLGCEVHIDTIYIIRIEYSTIVENMWDTIKQV